MSRIPTANVTVTVADKLEMLRARGTLGATGPGGIRVMKTRAGEHIPDYPAQKVSARWSPLVDGSVPIDLALTAHSKWHQMKEVFQLCMRETEKQPLWQPLAIPVMLVHCGLSAMSAGAYAVSAGYRPMVEAGEFLRSDLSVNG
ncbi:MAG: hypothetical protein AAF654_14715 [Myxococcota bacterium]